MDTPQHDAENGEFYLQRDGVRVATLSYSESADVVIISHTEVDPSMREAGVGGRLVEAAVEWARAENKRVMPLCSFAQSVFDRTPAYADVLAR